MPPSSAPADAPADETALQAPRAQARARAFGEGRGEDGECRRGEDGRAEPLHRAGGHQPRLVLGQAAEEARRREHREADQEDAASAEEVGGPTAQKQEAGEGQRVRVDDPLQARRAEVQVPLDGGQRHVHDGCVEHDHELADEDEARTSQDGTLRPGAISIVMPCPV